MNTIFSSRDFPLWIPPALVKELRQCMRTPAFMNMLTIVPCSLAIIFLLSLIHTPDGDTIIGQSSLNNWFWGILVLCMTILVSNWALGSMRVDIADKSGDLIMLTRLTPRRTVWGKWVAYMALAALIICSLLPFAIIRYFGGQISLANDLFLLFCTYLSCSILTAGAIWISGMPIVLRALFSLGTGIFSITLLSSFFVPMETARLIDALDVPATLTIMVTDSIILIAGFLLLSARWLSPPSINTATLLRCLPLLSIIPSCVLTMNSSWENLIPFQIVFISFFVTLIVILELTTPTTFLPIHIINASKKRFSLIRKIFFMPGLPSAAAFTLLVFFLYSTAASFLLPEDFEKMPKIMFFFLTLAAWYSTIVPALLLYPFQKKLGIATPIIYVILFYIFLGICGIFTMMKADFLTTLIPNGSVIVLLKDAGTGSESILIIWSSILSSVFAALWLIYLTQPWFRVWKKGSAIAAALHKKSEGHPTEP